ncbi:MAG: cobaltochelatase subunit CobN, partial [Devosia sp.]
MHLLTAQAGAIQQEGEAIDLAQTPGKVVYASSADSELALFAGAADRAGYEGLRLANLLRLSHHLSVDLWLEKTVRHARLVVLRLLGGPAYWPYGVDELSALARRGGPRLVLLPGDANPDAILRDRSTIAPADWDRLFALVVAGGPDNFGAALVLMRKLAEPGEPPVRPDEEDFAPRPFPRFGLWPHPLPDRAGRSPGGQSAVPAEEAQPLVPILFYRALLEGAGTATVEGLGAALAQRGLTPLPIFVSSLKETAAAAFVRETLAGRRPDVILNLTGFALGLDGLPPGQNPFATADCPVIQLVQGGRPAALWRADRQGLTAKDLAMQVVMPELDGRIGGLLVGHKAEGIWHARTQCPLAGFEPDAEGIARAADLALNWSRLRRAPRAERRVAIVLSNYPLRDGRLANGVGYDAPQSTVEILHTLAEEGYTVAAGPDSHAVALRAGVNLPRDGNALIELLQSGPTNAHPSRPGGVALPVGRYRALLGTLPRPMVDAVTARWGAPEADPFVRDAGDGPDFHLPVLRFGNVVVILQPGRTPGPVDTQNYHDPDLVPPHAYLAAYLWLRHEFSAHAMIHNGKHGTLEWLPGKAVALD